MKLAILVPIVLAACDSSSGGTSAEPAGSAAPPKKNGFSASLSAEMKDGSGGGSTTAPSTPPTPSSTTAGSGSGTSAAAAMTGGVTGAAAGSGSATKRDTPATTTTAPASAGTGSAAKTTTTTTKPDVKPDKPDPKDKVVGNSVPTPVVGTGTGPTRPPDKRVHVSPPADIAAIKLDLEPNWDRDLDEGATISFVLRVPNSNDTRLFSFKYGYDLDGAPTDREAYKKFLADKKVLTVTLDRQRGAAWYLEGTDGAGQPAFRYLVTFGGKRLVCGGSLYKDPAATALGPDLRDKVVAAAKKICETLAL